MTTKKAASKAVSTQSTTISDAEKLHAMLWHALGAAPPSQYTGAWRRMADEQYAALQAALKDASTLAVVKTALNSRAASTGAAAANTTSPLMKKLQQGCPAVYRIALSVSGLVQNAGVKATTTSRAASAQALPGEPLEYEILTY